MRKILFIIDRLSEGAGRVVYDLVKSLNEERFEPVILSIYQEGNLTEQFNQLNVKLIYLNKKNCSNIVLISKIRRIIRKERIDIVHTHNVDAYEYGVLAAWLAGTKKIIHTAHGKSVKRTRLKRLRENIFHKLFSLFLAKYIVVSNDLGKYVARNWCFNKRKIKTIYNGINTNFYKKKKVKNKLGTKKEFLIGIIAGLRPVKNHAMLIKAMKLVKYEIPNSKLLIIGDGPEKDKLTRLTNELGIEKDILFLGQREDITELLNQITVNILCSYSECLSITLLESMACEVPSIATVVGGNPEVITDGQNGLFVLVNKPEMLAEKIISLLKNKKLRQEISKKARETVIERFEVKRMIEDYENIY